jgi:hypothetical protein
MLPGLFGIRASSGQRWQSPLVGSRSVVVALRALGEPALGEGEERVVRMGGRDAATSAARFEPRGWSSSSVT